MVIEVFFFNFAEMADERLSIQLIDGDGVFNASGLDNLTKAVKLAECGLSYAVVSIMGPQSSGMLVAFSRLFFTTDLEMYSYLTWQRGIYKSTCCLLYAQQCEVADSYFS